MRDAKNAPELKRWTLLFVGNHGRTVTIPWFKGIALLCIFVVLASVGAAAWLYVLYQDSLTENARLEQDLYDARKKLVTLKSEKETLLTRLVLSGGMPENADLNMGSADDGAAEATDAADAQELSEETPAAESETAAEDAPTGAGDGPESDAPDAPDAAPDAEETPSVIREESLNADAPPAEEPDAAENEPVEEEAPAPEETPVAIENFRVYKSGNSIRVIFNLMNDDDASGRLTGRVITVFKPEGRDVDAYAPSPTVNLTGGRPASGDGGQFFSIARFKEMEFRLRTQNADWFKRAAVFVFLNSGELVLERDFTLN